MASKALFVFAIDATLPPPFLDAARSAVAAALVAKASSHPAHEAAVLFYGADDTDNPAHAELAAKGDPDHFTGIVSSPGGVALPDAALVAFALTGGGKGGAGASPSPLPDPLDAAAVAVDLLARARAARPALAAARVATHVTLIAGPSASTAPSDAADADEVAVAVAARLEDAGGDLHVIVVPPDAAAFPSTTPPNKTDPLAALRALLGAAARGRATLARAPATIAGALAAPAAASTVYFSGPLALTPDTAIPVKLTKALAREKAPSWAPVWRGGGGAGGAPAFVDAPTSAATTPATSPLPFRPPPAYRELNDEGDPVGAHVGADDVVRAYRYGGDLVVLPRDVEAELALAPPREASLVGFCAPPAVADLNPDGVWLVAPGDGAGPRAALSAVARAAAAAGVVAVLRLVLRDRAAPRLYAAFPALGAVEEEDDDEGVKNKAAAAAAGPLVATPDCFYAVALPFAEDVRHPTFPPLDAVPDRVPSAAQLDAARALVAAWRVPTTDVGPGTLANPARARALLVAARALAGGGKGVDVPPWDATAPGAALVPAPPSHDAAAAAAAFGDAFAGTRPAEGEGVGLEKVGKAAAAGRGRGRPPGGRW